MSNDVPARPVDLLFPGRREAIGGNYCMPPPLGCGKKVTGFRDELSAREYKISGLCQKCQDEMFGSDESLPNKGE